MATLNRGITFSSTETITNTKLHLLVDNATISGIVDADISPGAAIQFSKLLASAIDASLLVNLANMVAGAGKMPFANLPVPFGSSYVSLVSIPWGSIQLAASLPTNSGQIPYWAIVGSLASGSNPIFDGIGKLVGAPTNTHGSQYATSSGSFIAPSGVTTIFLTTQAPGGAGGGGDHGQGSGGGSGAYAIKLPYTVTPGNTYTYTIGAAGVGAVNSVGGDGGDIVFDSKTFGGGKGGAATVTNSPGAGGAASSIGGVAGTTGSGQNGASSIMGKGAVAVGTVAATGFGSAGAGADVALPGGSYAGSNGKGGFLLIEW